MDVWLFLSFAVNVILNLPIVPMLESLKIQGLFLSAVLSDYRK